jgi:hypothetical protein
MAAPPSIEVLLMLAGLGWAFTIERPAELRAEVRALATRLLTHASTGQ